MIITLLKSEGLNSISLPEKIKGQYWVNDYSESKKKKPLIGIEGIDGKWILKSNRKVQIIDQDRQPTKEMELTPYNLYCVLRKSTKKYEYLFVEPETVDRKSYQKYLVRYHKEITIGRTPDHTISFSNIAVSSNHASIKKDGGHWILTDENSTNGTYVNEKRITGSCRLVAGDVVYIMGLKIIIGNDFFAMNNPDQKVKLAESVFAPYQNDRLRTVDMEEEKEEYEPEYFYRSPRFKRDIETATYKVDSPPGNQQREEMPLMMVLGPSMTMGLASMTTAIFSVNNAIQNGNIASAIPSLVMSISMLAGTILWPILSKKYERKRAAEKEQLRQRKYRYYLSSISQKMDEEAVKQAKILNENFLTVAQCNDIVAHVKRNLWERELGQNDYLTLRVGIGSQKADIKNQYQERRFMLEDDNLQEEMLKLCEEPKRMEQVPITVSLFENYVTGVIGRREDAIAFAKGLLLQLITYYSYDELKLVFLLDPDEEKEFESLRWIPHVWDDDKEVRMIATNPMELKQVSAYLENIVKQRAAMGEDAVEAVPYYVVFALNRELANKAEMLKQIYREKHNLNISVITFFDEIKNLPKECTTVMELNASNGKIYNKKDITGERVSFTPDIYIKNDMCDVYMQLANLQLDIQSAAFNLPKMITFLEMYQVGKIEHLNALSRWKENDPTVSLQVPVGVDTFGGLFQLDLHEKYHGPHGLVAGMTGSGKSEFIMTYILSLALNYHPYEVAFILIDYKGGGMAKAFENLPHTAGIITNLDGAAVNRSLASIQSELKRRQAIFVEAGNKVGESNVDIYKYQKLYREGVVEEPLQHLFIISDEFAELKTQQPEFMEQLISAARIGRSLGVHLILATQKPAGVVDDQIWSNSKFKVCLKVQDRADSMDMLKRPDAAELSDTGRFYLQVGYNELFELGQSAWAGAKYTPMDRVVVEKDDSVEIIDKTGMPLKQAKPKRAAAMASTQKQLDAITDYLRQTAQNENIHVKPLWLEPIPEYIMVDEIEKKYAVQTQPFVLNPVIGEYDDPANQSQHVLTLDITGRGNVIVYGAAGMGKTTFLTALFYSLTKHHSWKEVNFFVLDFSSESLRVLSDAPHVSDVLVNGDDEKIANLFKLLNEEIVDRKRRFASYGGDMNLYNKGAEEKVANTIVMINNFAAFMENYDQYEDDIIYLAREGTKYGIYFVLAALNTNDVRYRISQNFNQHFTLQLNDESDYATVLGNVYGMTPSKHKGRGLFKEDEVYEFQTAYVCKQDMSVMTYLKAYCDVLTEIYGKGKVTKIPVLPEIVNVSVMEEYVGEETNIPVGITKATLECASLNIMKNTISLLTAQDMDEILPVAKGIVSLLSTYKDTRLIVMDPKHRYKDMQKNNFEYHSEDIEESIIKMHNFVAARNNLYKSTQGEIPESQAFDQVVYVIQDYQSVVNELSSEIREGLDKVLDTNETSYKVHFIIIDDSRELGMCTTKIWFRNRCSIGNGIYVGNGITDQYVVRTNAISKELRADVEPGFGFVVSGGSAVLTKLICEKEVY